MAYQVDGTWLFLQQLAEPNYKEYTKDPLWGESHLWLVISLNKEWVMLKAFLCHNVVIMMVCFNHILFFRWVYRLILGWIPRLYRGYPAKRVLSAMRKAWRVGLFGQDTLDIGNGSMSRAINVKIPLQYKTSTVYWCIASKLKAPRIFYRMSNMILWVEIFIFFVCYHVVPKRHSQLDYELNGLWNKIKLKTTRWRWCFLKIFTMTMSLESFDQLV